MIASRHIEGGLYASPLIVHYGPTTQLIVVTSLPNRNSRMEVYDVTADAAKTIKSFDLRDPVWTYDFEGDSLSTPLYYDGKIIHRSGRWSERIAEGWIYVLDLASGRDLIQPFVLGSGGYMSSPAFDGERLYVTTSKIELAAFDLARLLNGNPDPVLWRYSVPDGGPIVSSPTVANGYVYFNTDDLGYDPSGETTPEGVLYALDARTGTPVWDYEGFQGIGSSQVSPAVSNGVVIFASYDDQQRIDHGVFAFTTAE